MTLDEMRTSTRVKADEAATGFFGTTSVDGAINQGCRFVYNKLVKKFQGNFEREGTTLNGGKFNTVIGTQGYDLPTDHKKLVLVEYRDSSSTDDNAYRPVTRLNIANNQGGTYYPPRNGISSPFGYFTAGQKIFFRPVPSTIFTIRLWDVPRFTTLVLDTDEPVFDPDYHELACEIAALQILGSSGEAIFNERFKLFEMENNLMDETEDHRDHQPERMVISDDSDYC